MPQPGDVYEASLPVIGTPGRKTRPVLVVSTEAFSNRTDFVHLMGLSTHPPVAADTVEPIMVSGTLDAKGRIVTDVLMTEDVKFLLRKKGRMEPNIAKAAVERFVRTLAR